MPTDGNLDRDETHLINLRFGIYDALLLCNALSNQDKFYKRELSEALIRAEFIVDEMLQNVSVFPSNLEA